MRLLVVLETEQEGGVVGHRCNSLCLGLGRRLCLCCLLCDCGRGGCGHDEGPAVVRQVGEIEQGVGVVPQSRLVVRPRR